MRAPRQTPRKVSAKQKRKAPNAKTRQHVTVPKIVKEIAKTSQKLGCFKDYHELPEGCSQFDTWISDIATPLYKTEFFKYYEVISNSRLPAPEYYTRKIVTDVETLHKLERCIIRQKDWNSVTLPRDPVDRKAFERLFKRSWPRSVEYSAVQRGSTRTITNLKKSIECCITYRLWFRKECVRRCSPLIDTTGHDKFFLILQVLLAYIVVNKLDQ
jgi:hypothetical protein